MKLHNLLKSTIPAVLLATSALSHAASVDINGDDEIQKTVIGVWANNQKITFQTSGTYTMSLTDFGLSQKSFGSSFDHLGAMISDANHNIASIEFDGSSNNPNAFFTFDVSAGEYWLSLFAISDSNSNLGTFNMGILPGNVVSSVPLPAAFWFMATSLLGFASFVTRNRNKSTI